MMNALARCAAAILLTVLCLTLGVACHRRVPYVISHAGVVTCEVVNTTGSGKITELLIQQRISTNTYQERFVFDGDHGLSEKEALSFASQQTFRAEGLRETWIGDTNGWHTVVIRVVHPDGGEYYFVVEDPPCPSKVTSGGVKGSVVLATDPSRVLHARASAVNRSSADYDRL